MTPPVRRATLRRRRNTIHRVRFFAPGFRPLRLPPRQEEEQGPEHHVEEQQYHRRPGQLQELLPGNPIDADPAAHEVDQLRHPDRHPVREGGGEAHDAEGGDGGEDVEERHLPRRGVDAHEAHQHRQAGEDDADPVEDVQEGERVDSGMRGAGVDDLGGPRDWQAAVADGDVRAVRELVFALAGGHDVHGVEVAEGELGDDLAEGLVDEFHQLGLDIAHRAGDLAPDCALDGIGFRVRCVLQRLRFAVGGGFGGVDFAAALGREGAQGAADASSGRERDQGRG